MTIEFATLDKAADALLEAALLGGDWAAPLEAFARASGARGATLVRHDPLDQLRSTRLSEFVLSTTEIAEPVREYLAGTAPPDPRLSRVSPPSTSGFLTDLDQFSAEEIRQNAFYQEFLRPRKLRWHACARADSSLDHGELYLSLKRSLNKDHYLPSEVSTLNLVLPKVRMAATISRRVLLSETEGMKRALSHNDHAVIELDWRGRAVGSDAGAEQLLTGEFGLREGQLLAPLPEDQLLLERALQSSGVACAVLRSAHADRRYTVRVLPVVAAARDVFVATTSLAVVSIWQKPDVPPADLVEMLCETFALTGAEARVAGLIGLGVKMVDVSSILGISVGTARNYFKVARAKMGVSRQVEVASLIALMRG